jgi:hypothetical protein
MITVASLSIYLVIFCRQSCVKLCKTVYVIVKTYVLPVCLLSSYRVFDKHVNVLRNCLKLSKKYLQHFTTEIWIIFKLDQRHKVVVFDANVSNSFFVNNNYLREKKHCLRLTPCNLYSDILP